ncbi:GntP family permease [Rhodococcus sp. NPDC057529]|uniref:GntP family permease n=1 Tax=Rhodococcus sp. NPDC057529 TaxID=3346158 RepID=UPI0036703B9D
MQNGFIVINTVVAVLGAIALIVGARLSPIVGLLIAALYLGLTSGLGVTGTISAITSGFGEILAEIGLLIAFGVLTGALLNHVGAIERLVAMLQRICSPRAMPYSTALFTGTIMQSIFIDVMVVITAPMVRQVAPKIGAKGLPRMVSALAIGSVTGLVLVVPGAASVAIAGVLHVSLGKMILVGLAVAVPTILIATWIMNLLFLRLGWWDPAKDEIPADEDPMQYEVAPNATVAVGVGGGSSPEPPQQSAEGRAVNAAGGGTGTNGSSQPYVAGDTTRTAPVNPRVRELHLAVLFAPLLTGLLLISAGGIAEIAGIEQPVLEFLANPIVALFISLIGTIALTRYSLGHHELEEAMTEGFRNSGQILILTGAAGALASTITQVGLGEVLGGFLSASHALPLLTVWFMAAVIHVLIGTVTISAIMAVGVIAPVAAMMGIDPVLIALAAGSGSIFAVHLTSNTFWQFQTLFGQTVRGTLKTYTVAISIASVVSLVLLIPISYIL